MEHVLLPPELLLDRFAQRIKAEEERGALIRFRTTKSEYHALIAVNEFDFDDRVALLTLITEIWRVGRPHPRFNMLATIFERFMLEPKEALV